MTDVRYAIDQLRFTYVSCLGSSLQDSRLGDRPQGGVRDAALRLKNRQPRLLGSIISEFNHRGTTVRDSSSRRIWRHDSHRAPSEIVEAKLSKLIPNRCYVSSSLARKREAACKPKPHDRGKGNWLPPPRSKHYRCIDHDEGEDELDDPISPPRSIGPAGALGPPEQHVDSPKKREGIVHTDAETNAKPHDVLCLQFSVTNRCRLTPVVDQRERKHKVSNQQHDAERPTDSSDTHPSTLPFQPSQRIGDQRDSRMAHVSKNAHIVSDHHSTRCPINAGDFPSGIWNQFVALRCVAVEKDIASRARES